MKKYKVIVTARSFGSADTKAVDLLKENQCEVIKLNANVETFQEDLKREIVDADAVIAGLDHYTGELMDQAPQLKVISRYGVGYEKVDMEAAKSKNIKVTITPGANGESVSDMAVALMLSTARNIPVMDDSIRNKNSERPSGVEMYQKTLGIIGAGRIGQGVGRRCKGFGMRILCYDSYQDQNFQEECHAEYVDFDTLIRESDFITIHTPLTDETKNMFSTNEFNKMKNDAIIVNTARGGIIDEEALYEALKNGEIRGAGLDATVEEPPYESPLLTLDNCIVSPHAGAATKEAGSKMSYMAAQNVIDVLKTGSCKYIVA